MFMNVRTSLFLHLWMLLKCFVCQTQAGEFDKAELNRVLKTWECLCFAEYISPTEKDEAILSDFKKGATYFEQRSHPRIVNAVTQSLWDLGNTFKKNNAVNPRDAKFSTCFTWKLLGLSRSYCDLHMKVTDDLLSELDRIEVPAVDVLRGSSYTSTLKALIGRSVSQSTIDHVSLLLPISLPWDQCLWLLKNDLQLSNDIFVLPNQMDLAKALLVLHMRPTIRWWQRPSSSETTFFANCLTAALQTWLEHNSVDVGGVAHEAGLSEAPIAIRVAWAALTQIPRKHKLED